MKVDNWTARALRNEPGIKFSTVLSGAVRRAADAWLADAIESPKHSKDWIVLRSAGHAQGIYDLLEGAQG